MFAVIKTGGKQYIVSPGDKIKVEKLEISEGKEVAFSDVLLISDEKDIKIGTPTVKGFKVRGTVLSQGKGKKIIVYKYKAKKRYHKKQGHRQLYTEVEILSIGSGVVKKKTTPKKLIAKKKVLPKTAKVS